MFGNGLLIRKVRGEWPNKFQATVSQTTTFYNRGEQKKHGTPNLKVDSQQQQKRPHQVPFLASKNRKPSRTDSPKLDGRRRKEKRPSGQNFALAAIRSTVQAGGGGVIAWGMLSWNMFLCDNTKSKITQRCLHEFTGLQLPSKSPESNHY